MQLIGATRNQTDIAWQVRGDLARIGIETPAALRVTFGGPHLDESDLGWCDDHGPVVELKSTLSGGLLYFTFLHELGHAFGLSHTAKWLMAAVDAAPTRRLTLRNRRKWLRQFLRCLNNKRLAELA